MGLQAWAGGSDGAARLQHDLFACLRCCPAAPLHARSANARAPPPRRRRAVYQAGRVGAARQEQWWAAGGRTAMLMAPLRQQQQQHAGKRQRVTEAARDKENAR